MKKERLPGFYWIKIKELWVIGEWKNNYWYLIGNRNSFSDSYFNEINENKIHRT